MLPLPAGPDAFAVTWGMFLVESGQAFKDSNFFNHMLLHILHSDFRTNSYTMRSLLVCRILNAWMVLFKLNLILSTFPRGTAVYDHVGKQDLCFRDVC